MTVFRAPPSSGQLPWIPDDMTTPQFILDFHHPIRPQRPNGVPWLVADKSGKRMDLEEIQTRTTGLAVSLQTKYFIGEGDPVLFLSSNHIDYPICMWAVHRILGIVVPCNPALTVGELSQHIKMSRASLIIVHTDFLATAVTAARASGIPADRIIVITDQDAENSPAFPGYRTLDLLIKDGIQSGARVREVKLKPGEGKTRIAFYSSSSGTTGPPKIVQISHYAFIANVLQIATLNKISEPDSNRYRPGDACLAVLPFYHIYGLVLVTHFNMFAAISVVVVPKFNFTDMLRGIVQHKVTSLMVVPPQVVLLCKDPIVKQFDLSSVRVVLCAAAPLSSELYDQLLQLMPQVYIGQAYGSTEATGVVSMCPAQQKCGRFGGVLVPGAEGKVVKADFSLAGYNEEGELHIKTPAAATGYLDNDAATRETFVNGYVASYGCMSVLTRGRWIRSGDLVKIDDSNEIIVVDRLKEIMKVRGFQVAPAELEGCILDHPYAADACVVGVPHVYNGEVPLAFVVLTAEGLKAAEAGSQMVTSAITKHVAENKASFKHLHHVEIVQSVPKTPSGKLLRRELRDTARNLMLKAAKL
ncbi:phenylacetyl-CoA ligase [Hymenopellis radicata]|nr:phenylacetyl-CoA ligase [Hymenopellis radicata]